MKWIKVEILFTKDSFVITSLTDITKQKEKVSSECYDHYLKAELYDRVKQDPQIFEFIQSGSLDGIWYWDLKNLENEWLSPKFWEIIGYDPAEKKHLSSEWQNIIFPEDLKVATDNFQKHCEDPDHPYDQIVRYKHKNGSTVWIRCRGIAIRDENGKPFRMLGAHTNITSQKFIEGELIKAKEVAEASNAAKSQFLSNMSHEIRTPMNGFMGMLQLIQTTELTEEQQDFMRIAKSSADGLLHVINDILDYSKIEAGKIQFEKTIFNLGMMISDTIDLFKVSTSNTGLLIEASIGNDVPDHLVGDSFRLNQILSNLIGNAVKFTPKGIINIDVKYIKAQGNKQVMLEFAVKDTAAFVNKVVVIS